MSYIPKEYWIEHGKNYRMNFKHTKQFALQEKMLIDYLQTIAPFSTVLEVGCGFGRITKLILSNFPEIREYIAVDLSSHQIDEAQKYVNELQSVDSLRFMVSDIESLLIEKKYDLVLASEVLLHVLPSDIKSIIGKLVEMSSKHVVDIDWYVEKLPKNVAPHNFLHQYEQIYREFSRVKDVIRIPIVKKGFMSKLDTEQSIFHATIRS